MDANGANQTRLTNRPAQSDTSPTFSPDGTKIAFVSASGGTSDIWVMGSDGSNPVDVTNDPADDLVAVVVARRHQDRVRDDAHRQPRDLRDERRRRIADQPHQHRRIRGHARLVARRDANRVRIERPPHDERRRLEPGARREHPEHGHRAELGRQRRGPRVHDRPRLQRRDLPVPIDGSYAPQRLTNNAPPGVLVPADTAPEWQPRPSTRRPRSATTTRCRRAGSSTRASGPAVASGSSVRARRCRCRSTGGVACRPAVCGAVVLNVTATEPTAASYLTLFPSGFVRVTAVEPELRARADGAEPRHGRGERRKGQRLQQRRIGPRDPRRRRLLLRLDRPTWESVPRADAVAPLRHPIGTRRRRQPADAARRSRAFKVTGKGGVPERGHGGRAERDRHPADVVGVHHRVPRGRALPVASNLNFVAGLTVPNLVIVRVPASGIVDFYHYANLSGRTHLLADVVGYYDDDHSTDAGRFLALQVADRQRSRSRHRREVGARSTTRQWANGGVDRCRRRVVLIVRRVGRRVAFTSTSASARGRIGKRE